MSDENMAVETLDTPTVAPAPAVDEVSEEKAVPSPADVAEKVQRTFTQEDFDKALGKRLANERAKFADYDELKAKAEAADAAAAEVAELRERLASTEAEALKARIATENGVPVALLHGDTEDELKASAEALAAFAETRRGQVGPVVQSVGSDNNAATRDEFAQAFLANPRG